MNKEFNEYMDFFKSQPLKEKQQIIYEQLMLLTEFLEAIIVLINSIQSSICDYASGISDMLDKMNS